jgi:hypothetical protein
MRYCNYCPCGDCNSEHGTKYITHAKTEKGDWICDVCYTYECCLDAGAKEPCPSKIKCIHRPKIVSDWIK